MSLPFALLTIIRNQPSTGYELANTFDMSLKFIWKATHQQIYKELKSLLDEGAVSMEQIAQEDKPDKKRYSITRKGEEMLTDWINQKSKERVAKDPLMIKFFAGDLCDNNQLMIEMNELESELEKNIATLKQVEKILPTDSDKKNLLLKLALKRGELIDSARLEWVKEVKNALEKLMDN